MFRQRKVKIFTIAFILCLFLYHTFVRPSLNLFKIRIALGLLPNDKIGVEAEILKSIIPRTNGVPTRSVIVSSWRSGSSFLANMVNSVPGNYYHCEPLTSYGITQIRGSPNDTQAILGIKKLLQCDYTDMESYIQAINENEFMQYCNWRVYKSCEYFSKICYQPQFLGQICNQFPLQSMKLVRLRLKVAKQLLDDASLNVRILLLVRDPRGILQSRKHEVWCLGEPECDNPKTLCSDMVADYHEAVELAKNYPITFKVIRYEDLSLSPFDQSKDILQFYGRSFDANVEDFIKTFTKTSDWRSNKFAQDSNSIPFKWIKKLTFDEIQKIQESCSEAMKLWGYRKLSKDNDVDNFNPIINFLKF
ncbi:unnamed protein product [Chironomus riparius]|uniref:Sulfotransferase domain-containing protein n=1 Tax=Chironomus riparius TaxID=315576 RepID=A0A9N9RX01_9DIPT|nr:unnamed protein product [Chironomus riparius]